MPLDGSFGKAGIAENISTKIISDNPRLLEENKSEFSKRLVRLIRSQIRKLNREVGGANDGKAFRENIMYIARWLGENFGDKRLAYLHDSNCPTDEPILETLAHIVLEINNAAWNAQRDIRGRDFLTEALKSNNCVLAFNPKNTKYEPPFPEIKAKEPIIVIEEEGSSNVNNNDNYALAA